MALTTAGKNAICDGIAAAGSWISIHTADPGSTGTNEQTTGTGTYARKQTTWASASGGSRVGSQVSITMPAGSTGAYWGLWSAQTAGTFEYGGVLPASETFGAEGVLQITPTITGADG